MNRRDPKKAICFSRGFTLMNADLILLFVSNRRYQRKSAAKTLLTGLGLSAVEFIFYV